MAKVTLISRTLNSQVLSLAQSLSAQKNEVRILTSKDQSTSQVFDFTILTYFKSWSLLEALRLLPQLLLAPPDIFHFIFEESDSSPTMAHQFLLQMSRQLHRGHLASLGEGRVDLKKWGRRQFLKSCQAISVPSREKLMYLKRLHLVDQHTPCEVILPMSALASAADSGQRVEEDQISRWGAYFVIPAHADKQMVNLLAELAGKDLRPVFLSQRSERLYSDLKCLCLPPLQAESLERVIQHSQGLCLATHEYSIPELAQWQSLADRYRIPILAKRRQIEALPGLCLDGKNGFLIDRLEEDLRKLFSTHPMLKIPDYQVRSSQQLTNDQSLNQVNRLYSQALSCQNS